MPTDEITAAAAGTWTLGDRTVNRVGFDHPWRTLARSTKLSDSPRPT
jgi:hypothetical protein